MKRILLPLLVIIVMASGCIEISGNQSGLMQARISDHSFFIPNDDITVEADVYPTTVIGGKDVSVTFSVTNNMPSESVTDVKIEVYDECLLDIGDEDSKEYDEIKSNVTKGWDWKWTTFETYHKRDCNIGFRTYWSSIHRGTQDIIVLSPTEYDARYAAGTLSDLTAYSSYTENPLKVTISFLDEQPYQNGDDIYMYIDYKYGGLGDIISLESGDVSIKLTDSLSISEGDKVPLPEQPGIFKVCSGIYLFNQESNELSLNKELKFIDKEAPQTTCVFKAKDSEEVINSDTITFEAKYKYQLDNSLLVRIEPK